MVGGGKIPWGVVIATSNREDHFNDEPVDGVATSEPVRAIAAMAALAAKALARSPRLPVVYEAPPLSIGPTDAKNEAKT